MQAEKIENKEKVSKIKYSVQKGQSWYKIEMALAHKRKSKQNKRNGTLVGLTTYLPKFISKVTSLNENGQSLESDSGK